MRRTLAMAICGALALAGCGGGGEGESSAPSTTQQATSAAPPPQHENTAAGATGPSGPAKAKSKAKAHSGQAEKAKVRVPPISSAPVAGSKAPAPGVKTVRGGDDSVQTYGVEASRDERTEAAIAVQAYLDARRREDWAAVCTYLAQRARAQLEQLEGQLRGQGQGIEGCAGALAALSEGTPQATLRENATIAKVLSLRVEGGVRGNPAFLLFLGPPDSTLYSMPVYLEDGRWKVGLLLPSELQL